MGSCRRLGSVRASRRRFDVTEAHSGMLTRTHILRRFGYQHQHENININIQYEYDICIYMKHLHFIIHYIELRTDRRFGTCRDENDVKNKAGT